MDRLRRNAPEDKVRTSQLIQELAAQRERKLQGQAAHGAAGAAGDVAAASAVPLPGSFDEVEDLQDTDSAPTSSKPLSRLVRRDKAGQQAGGTAGTNADDVDGLASLMQGVGISGTSGQASTQSGQQQPQVVGRNSHCNTDSEDAIEDDDFSSAARRATAAPAQYKGTSSSGRRHPATQAASSDGDDSGEEDVASIDSQDSDSSAAAVSNTSTQQQQGSTDTTAGQQPAQPLVLEGGFALDGAVARKLYPHQIHGVQWLWSLHRMGKGGILADDMGLGKTMQCSAFLAGALAPSRGTSSSRPGATPAAGGASSAALAAPVPVRALIVAPKTLLAHWEKELRVCGMGRATYSFYGSSEGERSTVLTTITRRGGIMLTTYGMVLHNASLLMSGRGSAVARDADEAEDEEDPLCPDPPPGRRILWDYIILDEGHKIKNARTQLAQRLREIRARVRIIISGTPVQNNLGELHALMEFATPGLLGTGKDFKVAYEKPINAGQDRSAPMRVRELGAARAAELRQLVLPYILRREKKEVLGDGTNKTSSSGSGSQATQQHQDSSRAGSGGVSSTGVVAAAGVSAAEGNTGSTGQAGSGSSSSAVSAGGAAGPAPMGQKVDLVVWLKLTRLQRHIYEAFLHSDAVKAALNSSKSPLAALTVLKKVCDHPALLSERATQLVVSAASKPSRRKVLNTSSSSGASRPGKHCGKAKRRNSMEDFIVDDDSEGGGSDDGRSGSQGSTHTDEEDGSGSGSEESSTRARNHKAAARAAVANSLDAFSEEFLSWANTTGDGEGLERQLLADVGARGTESSCKSLFVAALLDELVAAGHRTLVFSQSRVMLDILQAAVKARGWAFCRIDGSMAKAEARQAEVERFQTAPRGAKGIPVFLLTTQVGGLGLTLTAADRVVIVDPSWNPATDNQSVDRAYRIGQTRDVVVYRLVTCGTVEEKIYRKQVFKGGLSKAGMEEGIQLRYFTHQELHELFKWDLDALNASETQQLLKQQHAQQLRQLQRQQPPELTSHTNWVEEHPLCAGTSQHGLLFSLEDPEGKDLDLKAAVMREGSGSRFRESGWRPRTGTGSNSSSSGSQGGFWGPGGGGSGGGGSSGVQPPAAGLDEMMKSLNIGGGGSRGGLTAAAALRDGNHFADQGQQQQHQERVRVLSKQIKQLQAQVQSSTIDLQQLGPRLPDGGAKIAARRDSLQAALDEAQAALKQLDPQAAAMLSATPAPAPTAAAAPQAHSSRPGSQPPGPIQQPRPPPPPQRPQQQQQQPWHQQQPWQQKQPPSQRQQPQQQQQQHWLEHLPPPPSAPPRHHQQQQQQQQGQSGRPPGSSGSNGSSRLLQPPPPPAIQQQQQHQNTEDRHQHQPQQQQQPPRPQQQPRQQQVAQPGIETLDGHVPTVQELQQRKHVLKKALQREDRLKERLKAQGQSYSAQQQQQWVQMYAEYKEIKQVLHAVGEAEAAETAEQQAAVIDLT